MNIKDIVIRKVEEHEIESLRDISVQTFIDTYGHKNTKSNMDKYLADHFSLDKLKSQLLDSNSVFFFVEGDKNQVIGYFKLNQDSAQTDDSLSNAMEIERIYLLKGYQGLKIGSMMIDRVKGIARADDFKSIWLGVWEENSAAIGFYKSRGFETFGMHRFILGTDEQSDIMMKLEM